jgi:hypothetical protein
VNLSTPTRNVNPERDDEKTFATCDTLPSAPSEPNAAWISTVFSPPYVANSYPRYRIPASCPC